MNKPFNKLIIQAIKEVEPVGTVRGDKDAILQKFAELIVRECVEQIINRERSDGEWYQDDIFKHFGVKE